MNVSQIQQYVKRQFGDESGVQVTDEDITRWINSAMRQIVLQNESLLEKTSTANSVALQQRYSLPVDLLNLKSIQYRDSTTTSYYHLKGYSLPEFNQYIDGWDESSSNQTNATPYCYTISESQIVVHPIPDVGVTAGFKIYYNRSPVEVSVAADTPELPVLYHESIVKYCLQQAYELDEDWDAVGAKQGELAKELDLLRGREDWKVQESYTTITVLPEDMW
jgi:hypothetical protein